LGSKDLIDTKMSNGSNNNSHSQIKVPGSLLVFSARIITLFWIPQTTFVKAEAMLKPVNLIMLL